MSVTALRKVSLTHEVADRLDRVHIGLVQLSTDHTLEMDWAKLLEQQACVFSTRIPYSGDMTPQALQSLEAEIGVASQLIATRLPMDVMAFGCTSASMVLGEERVNELLTIERGNIPTTNPWCATLAALEHLNVKRVAVLSPYPAAVNEHLLDQLSCAGYDCVAFGSFDIENDTNITRVSSRSIIDALNELLPGSGAQAIFMSCTNLRVLDLLETIENQFDLPALCSNSVLFWHAMQCVNKVARCIGYGQLLRG